MKKKLLVLLVPLALAVPVAAEAAAAAPQRTAADSPTPIRTLSCFPNFPKTDVVVHIDVFVVENKEKVTTTTNANGDVVVRTTGKLVLKFQNANDRNKTIVRNVSGPTTTTTHTAANGDVISVFEGAGNNWLGFGPNGQHNTGEPGLVFTSGNVVVNAKNGTATAFSLKGHQENGCALLS